LTKIGIIYAQLLQEEKISPMIPRSKRSAQWSQRYCTKMLKKLHEKLRAKFPATTHGYSMAKIAHFDDAFSECFKLEASPVEGLSLPAAKRKEKEKKER